MGAKCVTPNQACHPKRKVQMSQNRRIVINVLATYGRNLFGLICGLFSARWMLNALGQEDFGLYGLVGGLTVFITFFNGLMAGATARFYAFSVGEAQVASEKDNGLEECRAWFNTALMIHTLFPSLLVCIGYPIGAKVVTSYLSISPDKFQPCLWVLRSAAVSCFIAMLNVPFQAMYTAKQYIAELTVYSFLQTSCNFFFAWYMITHPAIWLVKYAWYMCLIQVIPQVIICLRARQIFPECHLNFKYWWDWTRVRRMWSYAGWQAFAGVGGICRGQGIAILVNKYFGAYANASMAIANQLSSQTQSLTMAMVGAFQPAITTACGARNYDLMRAMAFRACKFGTLLVLVFAIPLAVEVDEVLLLWLKTPPPYTAGLCLCMLGVLVIDKSSIGHMTAVNANGRVAMYQAFLGTTLILTLPFVWIFAELNMGVMSAGYGFLVTAALCTCGRVYFARMLVGMSARLWLHNVALPLLSLILVAGSIGCVIRFSLEPSLLRVFITTIVIEVLLLPMSWYIIMSQNERHYFIEHIRRRIRQ